MVRSRPQVGDPRPTHFCVALLRSSIIVKSNADSVAMIFSTNRPGPSQTISIGARKLYFAYFLQKEQQLCVQEPKSDVARQKGNRLRE